MSFRDEGDAQRDRIETLERQLATTSAERDRATAALADATVRLARLTALEKENGELRRGVEPRARTARMQTISAVVVGALVSLGVFLAGRFEREAQDLRIEGLRRDLHEERERRAELADPGRPTPTPPNVPTDAERVAEAILRGAIEGGRPPPRDARRFAHARVTDVSGEASVTFGAACIVVAQRVPPGQCRVTVTCDGVVLHPGSTFDCAVTELGDANGSDVAYTTASGDPGLELDERDGSVLVQDGPLDPWSVTITLGESS